jgi:ribonuclease P protein component
MRSAGDFKDTSRRGRRVASPLCVVHLCVHEHTPDRRVGVVVGKVVGNSVERHRAARRIRAAVRDVVEQLPPGSRVVIRALPGSATSPETGAVVRESILRALELSTR